MQKNITRGKTRHCVSEAKWTCWQQTFRFRFNWQQKTTEHVVWTRKITRGNKKAAIQATRTLVILSTEFDNNTSLWLWQRVKLLYKLESLQAMMLNMFVCWTENSANLEIFVVVAVVVIIIDYFFCNRRNFIFHFLLLLENRFLPSCLINILFGTKFKRFSIDNFLLNWQRK